MFEKWIPGLRAVVYLKRISESLERIADCAEIMAPPRPKLSRRVSDPVGEIFKPTVSDMNKRYREENPGFTPPEEY